MIIQRAVVLLCCCVTECGNGRCELGEGCTDESCTSGCALDCPAHVSSSCPITVAVINGSSTNLTCSRHGSCSSATKQCVCYEGYTGRACEACWPSYIRITPSGPCYFAPGTLSSCTDGVRNGNEVGVDCGGPNCDACLVDVFPGTRLSLWMLAAVSITGLVLVTVVVLLVLRWYRRRSSGAGAFDPQAVVPVGSARSSRRDGNASGAVRKVTVRPWAGDTPDDADVARRRNSRKSSYMLFGKQKVQPLPKRTGRRHGVARAVNLDSALVVDWEAFERMHGATQSNATGGKRQ